MTAETIVETLRTHRRLVVPNLGTFLMDGQGGEVVFTELLRADDGVLREAVVRGGRSDVEAAGEIDRFVFELRDTLVREGRADIAGVGFFTLADDGALRFSAAAPETKVGESMQGTADAEVPAAEPAHAECDSYVRNLRYDKARKREFRTGYTGRRSRGRADLFIVIAAAAVVLAAGAILYGYLRERAAERAEEEFFMSLPDPQPSGEGENQ